MIAYCRFSEVESKKRGDLKSTALGASGEAPGFLFRV
jgi:hypothetical protein